MELFIILLVLGAIAGVMSGMFGIGGGAIIVPSLMLFLGFEQTAANGTSLGALLLPVGLFGCFAYYRSGKLKILPALTVAVGLATATWFGASMALSLDKDLLKGAYGIFLLYYAWRYIAPRKWLAERRGGVIEAIIEDSDINPREPKVLLVSLGIGLAAGIMSGLFGIGGGVVIVPFLMSFLKFDQKLATGTSLGALLLPVGLPGVLRYAQAPDAIQIAAPEFLANILPQYGDVALWAAAPLAILLLIGAFFGAQITLSLPTKTIRRLYGVFLLLVGIRFIWDMLSSLQ
jgi:uncharacterized protein